MDTPRLLSASTLMGDRVINSKGEDLGKPAEVMLDTDSGCVGYAVLSFGGILGIGDKLFAIPCDAMRADTGRRAFILDIDRQRLEDAPGFDRDHRPQTVDRERTRR